MRLICFFVIQNYNLWNIIFDRSVKSHQYILNN